MHTLANARSIVWGFGGRPTLSPELTVMLARGGLGQLPQRGAAAGQRPARKLFVATKHTISSKIQLDAMTHRMSN